MKPRIFQQIIGLFDEKTPILSEKEIFSRLGVAPSSNNGGTVEGILGRIYGYHARRIISFGVAVVEGKDHTILDRYYYPIYFEKQLIDSGLISKKEHELDMITTPEGMRTYRSELNFNSGRRK